MMSRTDLQISVDTDNGWVLMSPPISHYLMSSPQILHKQASKKYQARAVLKKRRTIADDPRPRPAKETARPRPITYIEPVRTMITFPSNISPTPSRSSLPLPGLRDESLWLSRSMQPQRRRKSAQSPQLPSWLNRPDSPSSSYVISKSPMLPIGGSPISKPILRRVSSTSPLAEKMTSSAAASTSTLLPSLQFDSKLFSDNEGDFTFSRPRRSSQAVSVATSLSMYSQSSAPRSWFSDMSDEYDTRTISDTRDGDAKDTSSVRSDNTMQGPPSPPAKDDAMPFSAEPRLRISTSTNTTSSTLRTLVGSSLSQKEKYTDVESSRLSLQPCPSLASPHRVLRHTDLPPDHDAPSPVEKYLTERNEADAPPFSEDLCADYDYIRAIDVLIYGVQPLPDLPKAAGACTRRASRARSRRDVVSVRKRVSEKRTAGANKRPANVPPPVPALNRQQRKNSLKAGLKKMAKRDRADGRSIFFYITHFFGKPA